MWFTALEVDMFGKDNASLMLNPVQPMANDGCPNVKGVDELPALVAEVTLLDRYPLIDSPAGWLNGMTLKGIDGMVESSSTSNANRKSRSIYCVRIYLCDT
jgi:hypothetical protein